MKRVAQVMHEIETNKDLRNIFIVEIEEIITKTEVKVINKEEVLQELKRQANSDEWSAKDLGKLVSIIGEDTMERIFPFAKDMILEAIKKDVS